MNSSTWTRAIAALASGALIAAAGCTESQQRRSSSSTRTAPETRDAEPAPQPRPAAGAGSTYRPALPAGYNAHSLAFPTGDVNSSALMVHEVLPNQVRIGQTYNYEIHVTNLTNAVIQNVLVTAASTQNAAIQSATPSPTKGEDGAVQWVIGDLGPRKTEVIKLTAKPEKTGVSSNCVTASYNNSLCASTQVVEPALALTKTVSPEAIICDPITATFTVKNTGTGIAENVRIADSLPAGLTSSDGKTTLDIAVGNLAAGETKQATVQLKAARTGKYENNATASAEGGLTAKSETVATTVYQPVLAISCTGADRVFIGREAAFEITVKNTGDGNAANTVVSAAIPAGAQAARASDGGTPSGGNLVWRLGNLGAGQSKTLSASFRVTEAANLRLNATAQGSCAAPVNSTCQTAVVGIPALLLDGIDDPDPIQVGESTTYTLVVTNQGSAPLTNVKLICTSETEAMQVVSQAGATAGAVSGNKVTFDPIARLEPKAKATYRITVRALKEGQAQFKAEASSDEITRALVKTETTNFYR